MVEAYRLREIQREKFVENLLDKIRDNEDEDNNFRLRFALVLLRYLLCCQKENIKQGVIYFIGVGGDFDVVRFFLEEVEPLILEFSRAAAEANVICVQLLKALLNSALGRFHGELLALEISDPQLIFQATSAMAEVELEEKLEEE